MNIWNALDREVEILETEYSDGLISKKDFSERMRELRAEAREYEREGQ